MRLSREGLELIKRFEGYHKAEPDGSCVAYRCPAGVWTIGWGCTEDVHPGMRWSRAEAENALRRELAKFEAGVEELVTVGLNQHEFDALVSFAYNVGLGALRKSTLLKRLNAGDRLGAARAFEQWTKGGGRVLPGLVSRRKREAALFLKPVAAPADPWMAQAVTTSTPEEPSTMATSSTGNTAVTLGAGGTALTANEVAIAVSRASESGQPVGLTDVLLALAASPTFWFAVITTAGAAYVWLERRARLLSGG